MKMTHDLVPPAWQKYIGNRPPVAELKDRAESLSFALLAECMAAPSSPHWLMVRNSLYLCDETRDFIYNTKFGQREEPYKPGSRPVLEAFLRGCTRPGMSETDRVHALSEALRDDKLPKQFGQVPAFLYGESDEQTLLKGGGHCSCRGRVGSALSQIAGIDARPTMMWVVTDPTGKGKHLGGHTVMEARIDGKWAFVDPMFGLYVPRPDGKWASMDEIQQNPQWLSEMSDALKQRIKLQYKAEGFTDPYAAYAHRFFHPAVPILISQHDVNAPYMGTWNWATPNSAPRQNKDWDFLRTYVADLAAKGQLTDDVYRLGAEDFRRKFNLTNMQLPVPKDAQRVSEQSARWA